jgi:hypothetical protein
MVIAYTQTFQDTRYNPFPRDVTVGANLIDGGGYEPQLEGAETLLAAFGGELPPVLWDGLGSLTAVKGTAGWSLNLTEQGKGLAAAKPGPLTVDAPKGAFDRTGIGAPAALDERLSG